LVRGFLIANFFQAGLRLLETIRQKQVTNWLIANGLLIEFNEAENNKISKYSCSDLIFTVQVGQNLKLLFSYIKFLDSFWDFLSMMIHIDWEEPERGLISGDGSQLMTDCS
jgi:hypothetical protein